MIGLDAGVAKLATLSDGTVFEPVNSFRKPEDAGETSATVKPQGQIQQQQLAEAETQNTATAFLYRKYPQDYLLTEKEISPGAPTTVSKNHAMIVIEDF